MQHQRPPKMRYQRHERSSFAVFERDFMFGPHKCAVGRLKTVHRDLQPHGLVHIHRVIVLRIRSQCDRVHACEARRVRGAWIGKAGKQTRFIGRYRLGDLVQNDWPERSVIHRAIHQLNQRKQPDRCRQGLLQDSWSKFLGKRAVKEFATQISPKWEMRFGSSYARLNAHCETWSHTALPNTT